MLLTGVFPEVYTAEVATSPAFISPQIHASILHVNFSTSYSNLQSSVPEVTFLKQL